MTPIAGCREGMSVETLSAWGDDSLTHEEASHVRTHLSTCRACQERMNDYARAAQAIRQQRPPDFQDRLWRDLRPRLFHGMQPSLRQRRVLAGMASALALIALLAVVARTLGPFSQTTGPFTMMTATTGTVTLGPTVSTPPETLPGWRAGGLPWAQTIAFSISTPEAAFICGWPHGVADDKKAFSLGVSHDGAKTWTTLPTTLSGDGCELSIDPLDSADLVLRVWDCTQFCDRATTSRLYRSTDSGAHWSQLPRLTYINGLAWGGNNLYVQVTTDTGKQGIVVSRHDEPFQYADVNLTEPGDISSFFTIGSRLFVQRDSCDSQGFNCTNTVSQTDDDGAHWASRIASYQGLDIHILGVSADGTKLFAKFAIHDGPNPPQIFPLKLLVSVDQGVSWGVLPPPPNNGTWITPSADSGSPIMTPDGTIFAACDFNDPSQTMTCVLDPGATTWRTIGPHWWIDDLAVSWDAAGHPTAIWGHAGSQDPLASKIPSGGTIIGLQYHTP